jgi:hypothetical protein
MSGKKARDTHEKKADGFLGAAVVVSMLAGGALAAAGLSNFQRSLSYTDGMFSDVSADSWYNRNVGDAYAFGLMRGVGEDTFNPGGNISVAETVALAARVHSIYYTGAAAFTEGVPWYQVYADYAVDQGLITETQVDSYGAYATRNVFAKILAAALPSEALESINTVALGDIPDVSPDDSSDHVYLLYQAGILTGKTDAGNFHPGDYITRAEAAAVISRMADEDLRVSFVITPDEGDSGGTPSGGNDADEPTQDLADTVFLSQKALVSAQQSYAAAKSAYTAVPPDATLTAAWLSKALGYVESAADYAQQAADSCKDAAGYEKAYTGLNNAYQGCLMAAQAIVAVSNAPATADWDTAETWMSACAEQLAKVYNSLQP